MNSKQLHYFLVTVQKQSIAAAARELDVAQPAISQQLANLEREMGATLLVRSYKGVSLTQAGQVFAQHAETLMNQIHTTRVALQQLKTGQAGKVRLGMLPSINNVLSMALIEEVNRCYPDVQLEISTGPSYSVREWLEHNEIDIAITYEQDVTLNTMRCSGLINENMYLVVGTGAEKQTYASLAERQAIHFWELSDYELLIPSDKDALGKLVALYEKNTSVLLKHSKAYSGQLMTGLRQVMQGEGLMILPSSAIFHLEETGLVRALKIISPEMTRTVLMATSRTASPTDAMLKLADIVKQVVAAEQQSGHWRGELCFSQAPMTPERRQSHFA